MLNDRKGVFDFLRNRAALKFLRVRFNCFSTPTSRDRIRFKADR